MELTVDDLCAVCKRNSAESIKVVWNALDRKYRGKGITRQQVEDVIVLATSLGRVVLEEGDMIRLSPHQ